MSIPDTNPFSAGFNAAANAALNNLPEFQKINEGRNTVAKVEKYLIIGTVALAALGILVACTAGAAAIIPFVLSAALAYGAYNIHCLKTNVDYVIENPKDFVKMDTNKIVSIDSDAFKAKLKENTIGFGWVIDLAADQAFPAA